MSFIPVERMLERVELAREDSDTSLYLSLLYLGEMVCKIVTAGLVSAIVEDRERNKYRQIHKLVRADGIGDWYGVLDEVLTGPPAQFLLSEVRIEQQELLQKVKEGTWQYEAILRLDKCFAQLDISTEPLPKTVQGKRWLSDFAALRNKTRGHGAPPSARISQVCEDLEQSCRIIIDNYNFFKRSFAYVHRNLSGKYRVVGLSDSIENFEQLKKNNSFNLADGVYVYLNGFERIELIYSDVDISDFYLPNGGFTKKQFEILSYISGQTRTVDSSPYLSPTTDLPESTTQGIGDLDVQGNCFGNLPISPKGYIERQDLEKNLAEVLSNDRHPVITLVGRGGIGKTSTALKVIHELAKTDRYKLILWFSARDIDLLLEGPKTVKPHVLSEKDIAKEYVKLLKPREADTKGFNALNFLAENLKESNYGPTLFIFDNFETVRNPIELYHWLDTYIRNPNKLLITTRFREFKGDYPIEVFGMEDYECEKLIGSIASELSIEKIIDSSYVDEIVRESEGHPYVIKVSLGEVAKNKKKIKFSRIVAAKEDILDALFERTFSGLTPCAKRVFLTLSSWRSSVPKLALEAVLLRSGNERMDVDTAIDELLCSSFIEINSSDKDSEEFITVPLSASIFGERKLSVDPMKPSVDVDIKLLHYFGASRPTDIKHGFEPKVQMLFRQIANQIAKGEGTVEDYLEIIEYIARKYPKAYLLLSELYEEIDVNGNPQKPINAIRSFLEYAPKGDENIPVQWEKMAYLYRKAGDPNGEVQALYGLCQVEELDYKNLSDCANRLNAVCKDHYDFIDSAEKEIIFKTMIERMEEGFSEADATDCSRIAWLYMNMRDEANALKYASKGLEVDPNNDYCQRLKQKFTKA